MTFNEQDYIAVLPDFTFFKGDYISIPFEWFNADGSVIDLDRCEVRFYLFPYGRYEMPVKFNGKDYKLAALSHTNLSTVILEKNDTQYLDGNKYTYQPVLYCYDNNTQYVRGEGHIIFKDVCNNTLG